MENNSETFINLGKTWFWDELDIYPDKLKLKLIKADVEGGEYNVFKGAVKTITKNMPVIIFEFGLGAADYYDITPDMRYDLLVNQYKLKVNTMERWLSGLEAFNIKEFNEQFFNGINYYFMAYPDKIYSDKKEIRFKVLLKKIINKGTEYPSADIQI